jgi:hypothetical protein
MIKPRPGSAEVRESKDRIKLNAIDIAAAASSGDHVPRLVNEKDSQVAKQSDKGQRWTMKSLEQDEPGNREDRPMNVHIHAIYLHNEWKLVQRVAPLLVRGTAEAAVPT